MKTRLLAAIAAIAALAPAFPALALDFGANERIRLEIFDDIPYPAAEPAVARGGYNNYWRFRTLAWAEQALGDHALLRVRACSELRAWHKGTPSYEWPDELIFDLLQLDLHDIFLDGDRYVLGRQELGRLGVLFCDGTPLDGSRSGYVTGASGHSPLAGPWSADAFAIYNPEEDDLAIGNEHRALCGYGGAANPMNDAGAGLFLSFATNGFSLTPYGVWKHESAWTKTDGTRVENEDIWTFGLRLKGACGPVSGDLDGAWQASPSSGTDRRAAMAMANARFEPEDVFLSPFFALHAMYFSGDDPDTARNEGFNALWGRGAWWSDLVIFAYDLDGAGNWRNLLYAAAEIGIRPAPGCSASVSAGPMHAPEADSATGGHDRGWLFQTKLAAPVVHAKEGGRGAIDAAVLGEWLAPGDYYPSDETAYFLRFQLVLSY